MLAVCLLDLSSRNRPGGMSDENSSGCLRSVCKSRQTRNEQEQKLFKENPKANFLSKKRDPKGNG